MQMQLSFFDVPSMEASPEVKQGSSQSKGRGFAFQWL